MNSFWKWFAWGLIRICLRNNILRWEDGKADAELNHDGSTNGLIRWFKKHCF